MKRIALRAALTLIVLASLADGLAAVDLEERSLAGYVVDGEGEPIAGALIRVTAIRSLRGAERPRSLIGRTDDDGGFFVRGVMSRQAIAHASSPGFPQLSIDLDLGEPTEDLYWVLGPGGSTLEVTVLDSDTEEALSGVQLYFEGRQYARTDEAGRAKFHGIERDQVWRLSLRSERAAATRWITEADLVDGSLTWRVAQGLTIAGRVLDTDGNGVADANVGLLHERGVRRPVRPKPPPPPRPVQTLSDGTFELHGVAPETYVLRVSTKDRGQVVLPARDYAMGAADLIVTLPLGRRIEGRFSGLPRDRHSEVELHARDRVNKLGPNAYARGEVLDDGAFLIENITFDRGVIQASSIRGTVFTDFEFTGGATSLNLTIDFPAVTTGVTLSGRVTVNGRPSRSLPQLLGPRGGPRGAVSRDGSYLIEGVSPGEYLVRIGGNGVSLPLLETRRIEEDLMIDYDLETVAYSGTVRTVRGEPVGGATLEFEDVNAPLFHGYRARARADDLGRFSIVTLGRRSDLEVTAKADGFIDQRKTVGVSDEVGFVVELEAAKSRTLRLEMADGVAAERANWRVFDSTGRTLSAGVR